MGPFSGINKTPTPSDSDAGGIPSSIHYGGAPKLANHGSITLVLRGLINSNDHNHDFSSIGAILSRGLLLKVRYQSRIFHRDAGWKSAENAGWI